MVTRTKKTTDATEAISIPTVGQPITEQVPTVTVTSNTSFLPSHAPTLDLRKVVESLSAPLPKTAIKTREGGRGKQLSYIEGHTAINRLLEATAGRYDWEILSYELLPWGKSSKGNEQTLVVVKGRLTIDGYAKEDYGVQVISREGGEDLLKGATTDAFKRCARYFGLANELYGDDYDKQEELDKQRELMVSAKKRLMALYKEKTGQTMDAAAANTAAQEKYGKDMADLSYDEVLGILADYELKEAAPF